MQAGANLTHILELTFKQQIFVIFIVDYFYQKEFLKIEKRPEKLNFFKCIETHGFSKK
jgi:hypothetical protein